MNPSAVIDWQSALGVLVAGLVVGAVLLWRMRRGPAATPAPAVHAGLDVRDLEARRDALLQQLRELDDTASKRTPEQLARERYALELAAAAVLTELEGRAPAVTEGRAPAVPAAAHAGGPAAADGAPTAPANVNAMRGFLWGTATATALALLLFFVNRAASPREEGGSLTGTAGPLSSAEGARPMAAGGGPEDIEARLDQARTHLAAQDLMGVWNDTQFVLQKQPGHPRALSYQALVRLAMGQGDVAEKMLKQAMASAPDLIDAHLHLAVVYARTGRRAESEATLRGAMSRFPEHRESLQSLMQQLAQEPEGPAPEAADAHAGVAPPDDVHAGVPMATADGRPAAAPKMGAATDAGMPGQLSGVVELDPALRARAAAGGIVFVSIRPAGVTSGPPLAVQRFSAASLPAAFAITSADSMMGQDLPERVRIDARLDPDGDPMSRAATDPSASLDDVKLGSSGLRLVLK